MIDSMPNYSHTDFNSGVVDTINNVLYLGGPFQEINNLKSKAITKYDGLKFDTLGAGLDPQWAGIFTPTQVKKTIIFQNKLYVTGQFQKAGKYYSPNLARWNGSDWDTVNFRFKNGNSTGVAWHMDVYNNELYLGGNFDSIGGIKANNFAKFDGVNWHSVSYPYNTCVSAIANYKGKLFMAGEVTSGSSCANLAYYDGISWTPWVGILGDITKNVVGMKVIDSMLFVYGRFYSIAGTNCMGLAAWNGTKWFGYGKGVGATGTIRDVSKINGDLYISGVFDSINELSTSSGGINNLTNIAKFDLTNNTWCTIMDAPNNIITFTIEYNNAMYIAGGFTAIGTTPVLPLLKWIGGNSTISCGSTVDVGLTEFINDFKFSIYPNPTTSTINIVDENNQLQNATIQIKNNLGQLVFISSFTSQINLSSLSAGMYFLTIEDKSSKKTIKIIKQ